MREVIRIIDRRLAGAFRRLRVAARVVLTRVDTAEETRRTARITGLAEETMRDVELLQHYGFASYPLDGAEGVVLFLHQVPGARVVVATDDRRYRLELAQGEVALFTDEGDKVHLKRGRIEIHSAGDVTVHADGDATVEAGGIATVEGTTVKVGAGALESLVKGESFAALFNVHPHIGNLGAPTTPPTASMTAAHLSGKGKVE